MTTPNDERDWLERARAGDRGAFGRLVRKHQQRIHRLAFQLTQNTGDADDVTQETFLRAFRAIARFDGRADLFTWLYRICVNVALNVRRQRKPGQTDLDDPRVGEPAAIGAGSDPAMALEHARARTALLRAMDELSESLRTTLVMACVDQLPYVEIARVCECTEGTVAWRVHEARRQLRDALGDQVVDMLDAHVTGKAKASEGAPRGR